MNSFFRGDWPHDARLRAADATVQRWEDLLSARRLQRPVLAAARLSATAASKVVDTVRGRTSSRRGRRDEAASPTPIRGTTEWSGRAELAVRPTSSLFTSDLPLHRRRAPADLLGGLVAGWVRIDGAQLRWFATSGTGTTQAVVVSAPDMAVVELADLGRRRGGLTIATTSADELWLLLPDRRKVDGILSRLRYGS